MEKYYATIVQLCCNNSTVQNIYFETELKNGCLPFHFRIRLYSTTYNNVSIGNTLKAALTIFNLHDLIILFLIDYFHCWSSLLQYQDLLK